MIRVELPQHLRTLAKISGEARLAVEGEVTPRTVLDALEAAYPMLRGTIREYGPGGAMGERRAFLRFFAGEEDYSHLGMDVRLPEAVARGDEALLVVGAIAGG